VTPAVECDACDCPYNDKGFCEAELIGIRGKKCVAHNEMFEPEKAIE